MDGYAEELCTQILSISLTEKFTSLLSLAASCGFSLDSRGDVEELAEYLSDTLVKEFAEGESHEMA